MKYKELKAAIHKAWRKKLVDAVYRLSPQMRRQITSALLILREKLRKQE